VGTWAALDAVTNNGVLRAEGVSWDSEVFGFRVAQISKLEISHEVVGQSSDLAPQLLSWVSKHRISLISCRLPADNLAESAWLEKLGFRFVETVLHPYLDLNLSEMPGESEVGVRRVRAADHVEIERVASKAFRYERYHADPYVDSKKADLRYRNWIRSAINAKSEELLALTFGDEQLIGFFLVKVENDKVDWLLTAIAPEFQGVGLGRQAWLAMIRYHKMESSISRRIMTTISARNIEVLNLYASLGFKFAPPGITFHGFPREDLT